ncbi:hypothetical protein [Micromonospora sp. ATCC 39149]|uniref:Uncharacterized protein n=1 Tax=Micromonospora carbonacea TaxID=47853 RepID=A0A7D6CFG3_9ACTN|nr:hypothetical protein [Micromonospora sp. ATCC 39149]QLJ96571.1 hypothetical protein HZU44_16680 [Micromonospora carbonacea]
MTDTLLWRLAYDVAEAHQPDGTGRCRSLLCGDQEAPCHVLVDAERAMRLARGDAATGPQLPATRPRPGVAARPDGTRTGREAA